jgi:hypothetical protein
MRLRFVVALFGIVFVLLHVRSSMDAERHESPGAWKTGCVNHSAHQEIRHQVPLRISAYELYTKVS